MGVEKLKIKLLSSFFNNCDFIVRFAYTKIPLVRDLLQNIMAKKLYFHQQNYEDIDTDAKVNKGFLDSFFPSISFAGKTIMVVGPGTSLFLPIYCLLHGANKVYLIDPFPRLYNEIVRKYITYFEENTGKDLEEYIEKKSLTFNKERLCLMKTYLEHIERIPTDSIDIVISTSVLEHIKNIEDSVKELSRVLRIGGVMYHHIDLRDHYNFREPFKFLKYSDFVWNSFCTKVGYSYTNRLRADDYLHLFRKHHFVNIKVTRKMLKEKMNIDEIDKKFRFKTSEDLQTTTCVIVARRAR